MKINYEYHLGVLCHCDAIYTVSQKTSHFSLAIIFTRMVRLRQFLAEMFPGKWAIKIYLIFPPHLTSTSALPGDRGTPKIVSFHLNAACFFTKSQVCHGVSSCVKDGSCSSSSLK